MKDLLKTLFRIKEIKEPCPNQQRCPQYKQNVDDRRMIRKNEEYKLCNTKGMFVYCPLYVNFESKDKTKKTSYDATLRAFAMGKNETPFRF